MGTSTLRCQPRHCSLEQESLPSPLMVVKEERGCLFWSDHLAIKPWSTKRSVTVWPNTSAPPALHNFSESQLFKPSMSPLLEPTEFQLLELLAAVTVTVTTILATHIELRPSRSRCCRHCNRVQPPASTPISATSTPVGHQCPETPVLAESAIHNQSFYCNK